MKVNELDSIAQTSATMFEFWELELCEIKEYDPIWSNIKRFWPLLENNIFFKCSCKEMVFVTNVTYNYTINFIHKKKVLRMGLVPSNHMEIIFQSEHPTSSFNPLGKSTVVSTNMVGCVGCNILQWLVFLYKHYLCGTTEAAWVLRVFFSLCLWLLRLIMHDLNNLMVLPNILGCQ